jgi:hypothetical protein
MIVSDDWILLCSICWSNTNVICFIMMLSSVSYSSLMWMSLLRDWEHMKLPFTSQISLYK